MAANNQTGFALQELTLRINREIIAYAPNTLAFNLGDGERKSSPYSMGGGAVLNVFSENIETKFSQVKFTLPSVDEPFYTPGMLRSWSAFGDFFLISLTDNRVNKSIQFIQMILATNNDIPTGNDAKVEIEFHGNPALLL